MYIINIYKGYAHGEHRYSDRLWGLNDAWLVLRIPVCAMNFFPHTIIPPPVNDARQVWSIDSDRPIFMLQQKRDIHLTNVFPDFNCPFSVHTVAPDSFCDRSGTLCGLLLL